MAHATGSCSCLIKKRFAHAFWSFSGLCQVVVQDELVVMNKVNMSVVIVCKGCGICRSLDELVVMNKVNLVGLEGCGILTGV